MTRAFAILAGNELRGAAVLWLVRHAHLSLWTVLAGAALGLVAIWIEAWRVVAPELVARDRAAQLRRWRAATP